MTQKILIVDDDPSDRLLMKKYVKRWGYEPLEAADASTGERIAADEDIAAAILDFKLPDFDGVELFRRINRLKPGTPMILITGAHKPELTIQAMSEGLYHYMPKPADTDELRIHLDRAISIRQMRDDYKRIKEGRVEDWFIGSSPAMVEVFRLIGLFANRDAPTLIVGETGTGKELVARALHKYSNRRDEKFITVHLSALSQSLVESEIFGHEKGAFTGADRTHIGRFEAAGKGSLFIDELADIPPGTQSKLLRILEYGDFNKVGGEEQLQSRARLIIATNADPKRLIDDKKLREDLYFRLDVCRINLPPLRDRREDIPELVDFFIARANTDQKRDIIGVSNDVLARWESYNWPGNVRQLQNTIRRAVSLTRDRIITDPFLDEQNSKAANSKPSAIQGQPGIELESPGGNLPDLKEAVSRLESNVITDALHEADGNLTKAAQLIGLTRRELEGRMEKYGLSPD